MLKKLFVLALLLTYSISSSGIDRVFALRFFGEPPEEHPTIFAYAWKGLGIGLLGGLSAGYLRYGDDDEDDAKNVALSMGYGTLVGSAAGLVIGFADLTSGQTGLGAIILRDMGLGGQFGLLIGAIWGGINAMNKEDSRQVAQGMAWGYLGGVVFGLGIGLIEGPQLVNAKKDTNFKHSLVFLKDSKNNICPGIGVTYKIQ